MPETCSKGGNYAMQVSLKTLTPVWTGGVEAGKMDRIQETGIIGSLRWWYEALVRGLGGEVCESGKDSKCEFDAQKYRQSLATDERQRLRDAGLCDVCQVFGATGWKRRFRVEVPQEQVKPTSLPRVVRAQRSYQVDGKEKTPRWWLWAEDAQESKKPREGTFSLRVESPFPDFDLQIIAGLVQFLADWAAIGAKAQVGFGVVEALEAPADIRPLYQRLVMIKGNSRYPRLPSLQNIFLARIRVPNAAKEETFNLKYELRRLFANDEYLRHFIMGTVKGNRMAAKIKGSLPYGNGLMRVWGWVPEEADVYKGGWDREKVVCAIYQHLKANYTLEAWREMNSARDTVTPDNKDAEAFLRSLLGLEEEDNAT